VDVVLGVSVDRAGALAETFVFKSSGIPTYDEEALRTVRASAPFSSPPEKFLENDGVLRMSWTFTVYL
jgi:TonB family protein